MSYTIIKDPALEPFFLSKDQYCYTVFENIVPTNTSTRGRKSADGKEYQRAYGHYSKLSSAVNAVIKLKTDTKVNQYDSLTSYLDEIKQQEQQLKNLLKI
jgi:hypothetical protein